MKIEKVIEILLRIMESHRNFMAYDTAIEVAIGTAVDALEKQVAKEVRYEYDGYADGNPVYDVAYCPTCNVCFENGDDNWEKNYCPECGQKLKWEGEE